MDVSIAIWDPGMIVHWGLLPRHRQISIHVDAGRLKDGARVSDLGASADEALESRR